MLLTEYNERKYMKLFRKEAREEGLKEGLEEGQKKERTALLSAMLQNGATAQQISQLTGLPLAEIEEIQKTREGKEKARV